MAVEFVGTGQNVSLGFLKNNNNFKVLEAQGPGKYRDKYKDYIP